MGSKVSPSYMPTMFVPIAALSMRSQRNPGVRLAVIEFASTPGPGQTPHLRIFGDVQGSPLEEVADKLSGKVANHLPAEPMFHHTDHGASIEKGLGFLEHNTGDGVLSLFLLTDGRSHPPVGSIYSRNFGHALYWQALL